MANLFLLDKAAGIVSEKEKNLYYLFLLFFFSLYMPGIPWLYNVCMWVLIVYSFFFNTLSEKWQLLRQRPAVMLMVLFFIVNFISGLLSANKREGISWIGIRISLLVFPLLVGTIYIRQSLKKKVLAGFVLATCAAALLCLLNGITWALAYKDASLLYNDNLSHVIHFQSIYFAMLVNVAVIIIGYLQLQHFFSNRHTWWVMLAVLLPVHFLLASRMAIILLYGIIFLAALVLAINQKKMQLGLMLLMSLLSMGCLLFFIFPKTLNRFKEIGYTRFSYTSMARESHFNMALTPDQWNGANLRLAVWGCAWTVTRQHLLTGTGLGDKAGSLRKEYANKGFTFGIITRRNVHNTYLDVWMSLGLIGLLIFLAGFFILPAFQCIQSRDWFGLLIITCFFLALFPETYLDRTVGNTVLSFFISFIVCYKKPVFKNNL